MPARMPASGPSRRPSRCGGALDVGRIGDHRHLRARAKAGRGSLATTTRSMTCGRSRSTTCATIGRPASRRSGFSGPGPMRRPSPPASTTPTSAPRPHRAEIPQRFRRHGGTMRRRSDDKQGEEQHGFQHRQGRQLAASGRQGARRRRLVAGAVRDRRRAAGLQGPGRVPEEAGRQAGPAGRLQDRAHLAADPGSRPASRARPTGRSAGSACSSTRPRCAPTAGRGSASSSRSS